MADAGVLKITSAGAKSTDACSLKIAAFNVQKFGKSKCKNKETMEILSNVRLALSLSFLYYTKQYTLPPTLKAFEFAGII